ncbi:hypothetical protein Tco_0471332 [Tanacetum coccineum]
MDTTRAQQQELDDKLVAPAYRLKIGKSNLRLSSTLKSKEPTLQVFLDALKLTSFYNAFEISIDVPEIYMQEFCVTVSRHHSSLHFKLNGKSHTVNLTTSEIYSRFALNSPGQKIENLHSGMTFYLLLENAWTHVIVDYFMAKEQAILRRNKMFWHHDMDDFMFTTVRVISKHQDTQVYGAILPQHLTNQAMLESEAYMTYRAYATGEKTPKPKTTKKKADSEAYSKTKTTQATKEKESSLWLGEIKLPRRSNPQRHLWTKVSQYDDNDDADNQDDENPDEENHDDDDEQTDSDNDGDDFVHPKFSTHDDEARQEEINEEDSFDLRVQTPSHVESTNDESNEKSDEEVQGTNTEEENIVEEATHEIRQSK